jgi:hypothetical protein
MDKKVGIEVDLGMHIDEDWRWAKGAEDNWDGTLRDEGGDVVACFEEGLEQHTWVELRDTAFMILRVQLAESQAKNLMELAAALFEALEKAQELHDEGNIAGAKKVIDMAVKEREKIIL